VRAIDCLAAIRLRSDIAGELRRRRIRKPTADGRPRRRVLTSVGGCEAIERIGRVRRVPGMPTRWPFVSASTVQSDGALLRMICDRSKEPQPSEKTGGVSDIIRCRRWRAHNRCTGKVVVRCTAGAARRSASKMAWLPMLHPRDGSLMAFVRSRRRPERCCRGDLGLSAPLAPPNLTNAFGYR